jgi:RecB family exonuclease
MPLTLVRAPDARTLWDACTSRFLDQVGDNPGPADFAAHIWLAQESQADLLYETAVERGIPGWLGPPVTLMRQLPSRFEIRTRRVGLLTRRRLISRIASDIAREVGLKDPSSRDGVVRGHMLDAVFGELLPEGVAPAQLAQALDGLGPGDAFTRQRNDWIVGAYRSYLKQLQAIERIDTRQTNAMVAAIVDGGGLSGALGGATTLHAYGLYMLRSRHRLLRALAEQADVDVQVYALAAAAGDPETGEWEGLAAELGCGVEDLEPDAAEQPPARVQPAPDTQRETEWVARQVKRLLVEHGVEPHRIAVVARSGEEDTGRMHRALGDAGVVATSIVRARLTEIASLKALLLLFRGAAANWTYRALRPVLDNTLFDIDIDLRPVDFIASTRRVSGLDAWEEQFGKLIAKLEDTYESGAPKDRNVRGKGLWPDAVGRALDRFRDVRAALEPLAAERSESEWIELTLELLRNQDPAAFNLRRQLCDPVDGRYDVVRLDQRGVRQAENLLREWLDLDHADTPLSPEQWRQLLTRMLEANELSITTPVHKGVQVLEAHDAALLPFEHVFVIHANDRVFPRAAPAGGVLGGDERERLRAAGVPVSWRDLELQRERALWRAVTSSGEVTITYRSADPRGTPLLPSLLVPEHDESTELPRTRTRGEAHDERFVPVTAAQADQRTAVALRDRHTSVEPDAALQPGTPELLPHAVLAAVAESYRDPGPSPLPEDSPACRPSPWNGWLRDPRVQGTVAKRFGDDYPWSPSSLENYSKLPFNFLLQKVLRYEEAAEASEEVEPTVFGSAVHDLLEKFYARLKDDLPTDFGTRAETAFEQAAAEVLASAQETDEWKGAAVLWEQEWVKIRDRVRAYLEWELPFLAEKGESPEMLEYGFGFGEERVFLGGKDASGGTTKLRLCGRIDRVDRGKKGLQVLDYKSGRTPGGNDYLDGTALQAPLYMQVLENEGKSVSLGYYRSLKLAKRPTQYAGKVQRSDDKYGDALRFALSIPGRVRAGLFEPVLSFKAGSWARWHPDRDVARSKAQLREGNRYDGSEPLQPDAVEVADAVVATWQGQAGDIAPEAAGSAAEVVAEAAAPLPEPASEPGKPPSPPLAAAAVEEPAAEEPAAAPRLPFDGGSDD